jgi:hypothetical protein
MVKVFIRQHDCYTASYIFKTLKGMAARILKPGLSKVRQYKVESFSQRFPK